MKILYDYQTFTEQYFGGISLYFCEIMSRLSKFPSMDIILALRCSQNENLRKYVQLNNNWSNRNSFFSENRVLFQFQKRVHINFLNFIFNNRIESEKLLQKQDFDIFHPTYYNPYFLHYLQKKPFVLTVYDMIHEKFPENFPINDNIKIWKKKLIENADSIIAISENTKKDITTFTKVDPDKIHVIHLGNPFEKNNTAPHIKNNLSETFSGGKNYLLFVGTRSGYKNINFFIRSIAELLRNNEEMHIICAGWGPFTPAENRIFRQLNIIKKVHYFRIEDFPLQYLYQNARAFVFPSLYEGFGLPVLEAFSCSCPALLSNTSSLPEIGGPAAIYFDPCNSESISNAVERIINDENLRTQMIQKGNERVRLFSWEKTTHLTKKIYENVINDN